MRSHIKLVLFCLALLFILSKPSFVEAAPPFIVQPAILIPADKKDLATQEKINTYKQNILRGLRETQLFYSQKLNGKTFNFSDDFEIRDLDAKVEGGGDKTAANFLNRTKELDKLPFEIGVVRVVWVVGFTNTGGILGEAMPHKGSGYVVGDIALDGNHLLSLGGQQRDISVVTLAHELGHTFGLVDTEFAEGHTCAENTRDRGTCKGDPSIPIPPERISYLDIMNWANTGAPLKDMIFSNDRRNQEKTALYRSQFVNPQKDPPPPIEEVEVPPSAIKVFGLSPNTINAGQNFSIKGTALNKVLLVEIFPASNSGSRLRANTSAHEDEIEVEIIDFEKVPQGESQWKLLLNGEDGSRVAVPTLLTIKKEAPQIVLTAKISVSCGDNRAGLPRAPVYLKNSEGAMVAQVMTDAAGSTTLSHTITNPSGGGKYTLGVEAVEGVVPTSDNVPIFIPNPPASFEKSAEFLYPSCPASLKPSGGPTATSTPTPAVTIAPTIASTPTSTPTLIPTPASGKAITQSLAVIHGYNDGWFYLPKKWKKLSVGGRAYVNQDPAACVLDNIIHTLVKFKDASGADITTSSRPVTYQQVDGGTNEDKKDGLTPGVYVNCESYWANLSSDNSLAGSYRLTVSYEGSEKYKASSDVLTFKIESADESNYRVTVGAGSQYLSLSFPDEAGEEDTPTPTPTGSPVSTGTPEPSGVEPSPTEPAPTAVPKTVTNVFIDGQEVNLNNSSTTLEFHLPGAEGTPAEFDLPGVVSYSDGTQTYFTFHLKYRPPVPTSTPDPGGCTNPPGTEDEWRYKCTTSICPSDSNQGVGIPFHCVDGQWQNPTNDQGECTTECTPSGSPVPTPGSGECLEVRQYNECIGCRISRRIAEDSCGDYKVVKESQPDDGCASLCEPAPNCRTQTNRSCIACGRAAVVEANSCTNLGNLSEVTDYGCNDSAMCNNAGCQAPYTQCGGTAGLENEPANHIFYITPICNENQEIVEYRKVNLGRLENQCGN